MQLSLDPIKEVQSLDQQITKSKNLFIKLQRLPPPVKLAIYTKNSNQTLDQEPMSLNLTSQ